MFWRKDQPATQTATAAPGAGTATPIDPATEAARIAGLTGGQPIRIVAAPPPAEKRRFKLPGL
jgi:hypothetical protein